MHDIVRAADHYDPLLRMSTQGEVIYVHTRIGGERKQTECVEISFLPPLTRIVIMFEGENRFAGSSPDIPLEAGGLL